MSKSQGISKARNCSPEVSSVVGYQMQASEIGLKPVQNNIERSNTAKILCRLSRATNEARIDKPELTYRSCGYTALTGYLPTW